MIDLLQVCHSVGTQTSGNMDSRSHRQSPHTLQSLSIHQHCYKGKKMLLGITSVYVLVAIKNKFKKAVYTCENDSGLDAKSKT